MRASAPRTYLETPLLFFGLTVFLYLVYGSETKTMMPISLPFFLVPCCGLYYALRLKTPSGRWHRRLMVDALHIAVPNGKKEATLVDLAEFLPVLQGRVPPSTPAGKIAKRAVEWMAQHKATRRLAHKLELSDDV